MKTLYAAIAAVMLLITPASAQESCGTIAQAEQMVAEYKEIPIITWIDPKGTVIMVYANLDTGTTTAFAVKGDRVCIVSEGKGAHIGPAKPRPPGKDEL